MREFENGVSRRIFETSRQIKAEDDKHNKEDYKFYSSINIGRIIKSNAMGKASSNTAQIRNYRSTKY
jgi:hypothetical protein